MELHDNVKVPENMRFTGKTRPQIKYASSYQNASKLNATTVRHCKTLKITCFNIKEKYQNK